VAACGPVTPSHSANLPQRQSIDYALVFSLDLTLRKRTPYVPMLISRLSISNATQCGKYAIGAGGPSPPSKNTRLAYRKRVRIHGTSLRLKQETYRLPDRSNQMEFIKIVEF
jgi:hypothetical protein